MQDAKHSRTSHLMQTYPCIHGTRLNIKSQPLVRHLHHPRASREHRGLELEALVQPATSCAKSEFESKVWDSPDLSWFLMLMLSKGKTESKMGVAWYLGWSWSPWTHPDPEHILATWAALRDLLDDLREFLSRYRVSGRSWLMFDAFWCTLMHFDAFWFILAHLWNTRAFPLHVYLVSPSVQASRTPSPDSSAAAKRVRIFFVCSIRSLSWRKGQHVTLPRYRAMLAMPSIAWGPEPSVASWACHPMLRPWRFLA